MESEPFDMYEKYNLLLAQNQYGKIGTALPAQSAVRARFNKEKPGVLIEFNGYKIPINIDDVILVPPPKALENTGKYDQVFIIIQ